MSSTEQQPGAPASTARSAAPNPSRSRVGERETLRTLSLPGLTLAVRGRHETAADAADAAEDTRPTALYVHGLGGSSLNWSALMAELAPDVRGEALDLPGFGDSPPPDSGDYSVSGHARAVIRYLDAGGRAPVHLLGNSLGGAVATRVAAVRPDLVRTLTLVSPALPEIPPQRTAWPTALLAVPGIAALFDRLTRDWSPERRTGGVLGLCYGDPARVSAEDFAAASQEYARRVQLPYFWDAMVRSTRGIVDAYTLGGQHALWRQAERVLAPTLLVYGGARPTGRLPGGAACLGRFPRFPAARPAGSGPRRHDGVPRDRRGRGPRPAPGGGRGDTEAEQPLRRCPHPGPGNPGR